MEIPNQVEIAKPFGERYIVKFLSSSFVQTKTFETLSEMFLFLLAIAFINEFNKETGSDLTGTKILEDYELVFRPKAKRIEETKYENGVCGYCNHFRGNHEGKERECVIEKCPCFKFVETK